MKPRTRIRARADALVALAAPAIGPLVPNGGPASVSIAATFDGLLRASTTAPVLHDRPVEDVVQEIAAAWDAAHVR
jgi:hypothetical protein